MTAFLGGRSPGSLIRVCVCGGGSLAHALAAVLGARPWIEMRVLTRQPARWSPRVRLLYLDRAELMGRIARISADPAAVIPGAELVIVAVPHIARGALLARIAPWLDGDAWLGGFPGYGGFAWHVRHALGPGRPFFGLQRVPYVRKVVSYGQVVWVSGIRPVLLVGAVPAAEAPSAAAWLEAALGIPSRPLASYLAVCLSNSNPIFHPSRLYALWHDQPRDLVWPDRPQFYEDWDERSSEIYLACDDELQAIGRALPANLSDSPSLLAHYRLTDRAQVTPTIRALTALRDRPLPMRVVDGGWTPDLHTYYFTEDVPHGLVVQRSLAELAGVATPMIDRILRWAERWMDRRWLDGERVRGPDAATLPLPQHVGITSSSALVEASA